MFSAIHASPVLDEMKPSFESGGNQSQQSKTALVLQSHMSIILVWMSVISYDGKSIQVILRITLTHQRHNNHFLLGHIILWIFCARVSLNPIGSYISELHPRYCYSFFNIKVILITSRIVKGHNRPAKSSISKQWASGVKEWFTKCIVEWDNKPLSLRTWIYMSIHALQMINDYKMVKASYTHLKYI